MKCFIKAMKTFELLGVHDVVAYSIVDGDVGEVQIFQNDADNLQQNYVGQWLLVDNTVLYIGSVTPDNDLLLLSVQHPIYAFGRLIPQVTQTTFGAAIVAGLNTNYINCTDDDFKLSYIQTANTDATSGTVEADDYGYFQLSALMETARKNGVDIAFTVTGTHSQNLKITISTAAETELPIVFGDGHHVLESEAYDNSKISKATVLTSSENETTGAITITKTDFYLSADGHISTTPPAARASGDWNVYEATDDELPLAVATGAFSANSDSHKIDFSSDREYKLHQKLRLRLRGEVFKTSISCVTKSSDSDWIFYQCGDLSTTLTDAIQDIEETTTVTSINGKDGRVLLTASDLNAVPVTRKVNGKALSSNITLKASDVESAKLIRVGRVDSTAANTHTITTNGTARYIIMFCGTNQARTGMYLGFGTNDSCGAYAITAGSALSLTFSGNKTTLKGTTTGASICYLLVLDGENDVVVE